MEGVPRPSVMWPSFLCFWYSVLFFCFFQILSPHNSATLSLPCVFPTGFDYHAVMCVHLFSVTMSGVLVCFSSGPGPGPVRLGLELRASGFAVTSQEPSFGSVLTVWLLLCALWIRPSLEWFSVHDFWSHFNFFLFGVTFAFAFKGFVCFVDLSLKKILCLTFS